MKVSLFNSAENKKLIHAHARYSRAVNLLDYDDNFHPLVHTHTQSI